MKKGKSRNKRKKTRSRLLWIAIAVIGIAAVISAVCVAGMLATKENIWRTPEELLVEYMDHITKQEYEEMYGLNVHAVIFDELHAQSNRELFDVMTKGSGDARTQPLYFLITTAGTDRNSICFEQHQKAVDIIEGRKIDPTFYPLDADG